MQNTNTNTAVAETIKMQAARIVFHSLESKQDFIRTYKVKEGEMIDESEDAPEIITPLYMQAYCINNNKVRYSEGAGEREFPYDKKWEEQEEE